MAWAQEEPSECVELGAHVYQNWTKDDSGGSGMPAGETSADYLRCKACHGWDLMGTEGGYVRRSRNDGRPNAGAGDGDTSSRVISPIMGGHDPITADMITHGGTGRSYADGSGSWTALIDPRSATNTGAYAGGYTLGNQHPDLSMDGANTGDIVLTQEQIDCVVEFLNFSSADPSAYFADINPGQNPVLYTIVDTADAAAGETFYDDNCFGCHGDPATDHQGGNGGHPDGGLLVYLGKDGKFSEFAHKARWGIPDEIMSRSAMGSPTSADVANVMLYLQELGGTGFAMTPGMTGTWWNGPERAGEGFPVEVGFQADGTMILWVTFFTYNNMGNQTWLTAQGTVTGTTIDVDVFMPKGPMWGMDFDPADVEPTPWGSGTFTFSSCSSGHMSLEPNGDMMGMMGFTDLDYDLMRFDENVISGIDCPN
jgi:mono/diheme cytochrome c family protein